MNRQPSAAYYVRGFTALMAAGKYTTRTQLLDDLRVWREAWQQHPAYVQAEPWEIFSVGAVGVWQHPAGRDDHIHSYVIGMLHDIVASMSWGHRTYGGEFVEFAAIPPHFPFSHIRITTVSYSYHGAGGAAEARKRLRAIMPPVVRPYVQRCRTWNRWAKYKFCDCGSKVHTADCRKRTKAQIIIDEKIPPNILSEINKFMPPSSFWLCATGRVHPHDIREHYHVDHGKQLKLFD